MAIFDEGVGLCFPPLRSASPTSASLNFFKRERASLLVLARASRSSLSKLQGRVVRKPVNTNPGLKVNRSIDFSCIKMFFAFASLRLFKLKRECQTI